MIEDVADAEDEFAPRNLLASFGPAVAVILGVSVWAQLASFTLRDEIAVDPGPLRVLAFLIPFIALVAGVWFRSAIALLALFPMALLPPLFLTPDGAAASFADPWSAARVCASFALYLALVSAWLGAVDVSPKIRRGQARQRGGEEYRRHVYTRLVPLLLWWAVPTYAIFWDPAIVGTISQSYGDDARVAQLFLSTLVFFGWCVIGYMSFIVPSLNLEYDRRRIERKAVALVNTTDRSTITRRLVVTFAVAAGSTFLLLLLV